MRLSLVLCVSVDREREVSVATLSLDLCVSVDREREVSIATLSLDLCVSVDREKGGECSYIITGSLCECGWERERGVVVILHFSD